MSCKQNWNEEIWVHGGKKYLLTQLHKAFRHRGPMKEDRKNSVGDSQSLMWKTSFLDMNLWELWCASNLLNLWKILVTITHVGFIIWFRTDVKVKDLTRRGRVGIQSVTDMSKKFSYNNGWTWQVHSCRTSVICTLTYSQNSRQTPFNGCISRNLTNLL